MSRPAETENELGSRDMPFSGIGKACDRVAYANGARVCFNEPLSAAPLANATPSPIRC
jgi:hypothetical protein